MRNLELKTTMHETMTMGYQYRLLRPELVFHGQLRIFLDEISKSIAAQRLAIELAATSVLEDGKVTLICCLNIRVFTEDGTKTLYELFQVACKDVCKALKHAGIEYRKARFDDEGTVAAMPVWGYSYLVRYCTKESKETGFYAEIIQDKKHLNLKRLKAILTASPGSGISLQLMQSSLNYTEMEYITYYLKEKERETEKASVYYRLLDENREQLYTFTCAVWGRASEEILNDIMVSSKGSLIKTDLSMRGLTEYDDVTIDPWNLCSRMCEELSEEELMYRLPNLITQDELVYLFAEEELAAGTEALKQTELAYLGVSSEEELGMTKRQLDTLKRAIEHIRLMGIFSGKIVTVQNYFSYVSMLGYLYELLMKECYHTNVYEPYCKFDKIVPDDIARTELYCYDQGPLLSQRWDWNVLAQNLESGISFGSNQWSASQWHQFLSDISYSRKLRNKVHAYNRKGVYNLIDKKEACAWIELMLKGKDSLMRRILLCSNATAVFK